MAGQGVYRKGKDEHSIATEEELSWLNTQRKRATYRILHHT